MSRGMVGSSGAAGFSDGEAVALIEPLILAKSDLQETDRGPPQQQQAALDPPLAPPFFFLWRMAAMAACDVWR